MLRGIELGELNHEDECNRRPHRPHRPHRPDRPRPDKECSEKHKFRVANATLEIAIDVNTDFSCETD